MIEGNRRSPRRHAEVLTGLLALLSGLVTLGILIFAPMGAMQLVYPTGTSAMLHPSLWDELGPFFFWPLGLVALVICLLSLVAIGAGAVTHGVRQMARGRLWLQVGTVVLALEIAAGLTLSVLVAPPIRAPIYPINYFAPYLVPALVLASFASGAAI